MRKTVPSLSEAFNINLPEYKEALKSDVPLDNMPDTEQVVDAFYDALTGVEGCRRIEEMMGETWHPYAFRIARANEDKTRDLIAALIISEKESAFQAASTALVEAIASDWKGLDSAKAEQIVNAVAAEVVEAFFMPAFEEMGSLLGSLELSIHESFKDTGLETDGPKIH